MTSQIRLSQIERQERKINAEWMYIVYGVHTDHVQLHMIMYMKKDWLPNTCIYIYCCGWTSTGP